MTNRETISRIRQELTDRRVIKGNEIATQGYLRLAANVQTGSALNSITWNVLSNQGTQRATEVRLDITDMFTVTHWGLYLCKAGSSTAATDSQISSAHLFTNPNRLTFSDTTNTPNETDALMHIYNGFMSVTVDRNRIIDKYDAMRFYRVGNAQKGVLQAYNATAPSGTSLSFIDDQWDNVSYGMANCDPNVTLNGVGDNNITLTLPSAANLGGASSTNLVFLIMRGIRWQNASKLNA